MSKLIVGCGYLGQRVARRWQSEGHRVVAVTRSIVHAAEFAELGWEPIVADILNQSTLPTFSGIDDVLFAVGFESQQNGPSIHEVFVKGLENVLGCLPTRIRRFIYISSTGVYSQNQGEWVDEDSVCEPIRSGGIACLEAERLLSGHSIAPQVIVLRLAGLYGPGRIPRAADIQAGRAIAAPANGYLNLIHVDDATEVVAQICKAIVPPTLLTVSDGHPVLRREYLSEMARILRAPMPTFTTPSSLSPASLRAATDKRVSNRRLIERLQIRLKYPTYRHGLSEILTEESSIARQGM